MSIGYVSTYGAVDDDSTDCTAAIQQCIDNNDLVIFDGTGTYKITSCLTLPQTRNVTLQGSGFRQTMIKDYSTGGTPSLSYVRGNVGGSVLCFKNLIFSKAYANKPAGSCAIQMFGYSDIMCDNWLRIESCCFYGYDSGIYSKWTGQAHITRCWFQNLNRAFDLLRACNQWNIDSCFSLGNGSFMRATDTAHDGVSNGLMISNCGSVLSSGNDFNIEGYQLVNITNTGCDTGTSTSGEAIRLYFCQDCHIDNCWISSYTGTRDGVRFDGSHSSTLTNSTIVNSNVGVRIYGVQNMTTAIAISNNKFDGNFVNDVIFQGYVTGSKLISNHHNKQMSRTGTNFEVYTNTPGTNGNVILANTFKGTSYLIVAGSNSYITGNLFSV